MRAVASRPWSGTANLEISHVWIASKPYKSQIFLDDHPVSAITAYLTPKSGIIETLFRLAKHANLSFKGSDPLGAGFIIEDEEARGLIEENPKNSLVVLPFLNGEDLNSRPDQSASRWAICFYSWPLDKRTAPEGYSGPVAVDYPKCLAIIDERVRPGRQRLRADGKYVLSHPLPEKWWLYNRARLELYQTIADMQRVLVRPEVSSMHAFVFATPGVLFSNLLCVFPLDDWLNFAVLQSSVHEVWSRKHGSTLETRMRYTPSDCFETFPFPPESHEVAICGELYYKERSQTMLIRQEWLTKTYNRFHDPDETSADIQKLRELHVEMDAAVAAAYGWSDLNLDHGFHETKQGIRYTISEPARCEALARLLKLNHERYAEEVKQGLHEKKKQKARKGKKEPEAAESGRNLFGEE